MAIRQVSRLTELAGTLKFPRVLMGLMNHDE